MQPSQPLNYNIENIHKNVYKFEDLRIKNSKSEEKTPQYKRPIIQIINQVEPDNSSAQKKVNTPVVKSFSGEAFPPKPAPGEKLVPPPKDFFIKQSRPLSKSKFNSDNSNSEKEPNRTYETNPKVPKFVDNFENDKPMANANKGVSDDDDDDDDEEGYIGETPGEIEHTEPLEKNKDNNKLANPQDNFQNNFAGIKFTDSINLSEKSNEIPQINFTQSASVQDSVIVDKLEDNKEKSPQPNFQNIIIPQESPITNFQLNPQLFKKEIGHSINKIKICNENHIKDIISFDKKERKAYCKNCGSSKNDLVKINQFINEYNTKIDQVKNCGTIFVANQSFAENELASKKYSIESVESSFNNYIEKINFAKKLIIKILEKKINYIEQANSSIDALSEKFGEVKKCMIARNWYEMLNQADLDFIEKHERIIEEAKSIVESQSSKNKDFIHEIKIPTFNIDSILKSFQFNFHGYFNESNKVYSQNESVYWFNGKSVYRHVLNHKYFSFCSNKLFNDDFKVEIKIIRIQKKGSFAFGICSYFLEMEFGRVGFEVGGNIISICDNGIIGNKGKEYKTDTQLAEGDNLQITVIDNFLSFKLNEKEIYSTKEKGLLPAYIVASVYSKDDEIEINKNESKIINQEK